jgi:hypothetical protein
MHSILSFFALDGEFRALAGGGVFPPIPPSIRAPKPGQNQGQESDTASQSQSNSKGKGKKGESEDKSGGKQYYGHPSAGLPRSLAFPLCQEYLLANIKETINIANAPAFRPHHHNKKSFYKHHHHHHEHVRYVLSYTLRTFPCIFASRSGTQTIICVLLFFLSSPLFSSLCSLITLPSPFCRSPEYEASTENMAFAVPAAADALVKKVWNEKNIHKKYDEKNLLQKALKRSKTNSSYWGGKDYVKQSAYTTLDSLTKGFIDASSIYCPSLVPSKISTTHHTFSSNNSENASVNSQDAAEKEVRTYSVHSVLTYFPTL